MKIFGREPALWLSLIYSAVVMLSAFWFDASPERQGAVNAVAAALVGLLTAWMVARDGLQAAILGFIKSLLALGLAFGLHLTTGNQAIIMSFVGALIAMFVRTQATAAVTASGERIPKASVA